MRVRRFVSSFRLVAGLSGLGAAPAAMAATCPDSVSYRSFVPAAGKVDDPRSGGRSEIRSYLDIAAMEADTKVRVIYYQADGARSVFTDCFSLVRGARRRLDPTTDNRSWAGDRVSAVVESEQDVGVSVVQQRFASDPRYDPSGRRWSHEHPSGLAGYAGYAESSLRNQLVFPFLTPGLASASGRVSSKVVLLNPEESGWQSVRLDFRGDKVPNGSGRQKDETHSFPLNQHQVTVFDVDAQTGLPDGWYGSLTVTADRKIVPLVDTFVGSDSLMAYSGLAPASQWGFPLVTSVLANGLVVPVSFTNVSGSRMEANRVSLVCTGGAAGQGSFTLSNRDPVDDKTSYHFNPVLPGSGFPDRWYGGCTLTAPGNVAAFAQPRTLRLENNAAYEGFPMSASGAQGLVVPFMRRDDRPQQIATAVTVMNTGVSGGDVEFQYWGGGSLPWWIFKKRLEPGESFIQNGRIRSGPGFVALPNQWEGTLIVRTTDPNVSLAGYNQVTERDGESTWTSRDSYGNLPLSPGQASAFTPPGVGYPPEMELTATGGETGSFTSFTRTAFNGLTCYNDVGTPTTLNVDLLFEYRVMPQTNGSMTVDLLAVTPANFYRFPRPDGNDPIHRPHIETISVVAPGVPDGSYVLRPQAKAGTRVPFAGLPAVTLQPADGIFVSFELFTGLNYLDGCSGWTQVTFAQP